MIKTTHEISNEDGYIKYNFFEIHPDLEEIIADDYFTYATKDFKKQDLCEELYKKNFYDKYDEANYKEVYEKYINNENFKAKAMFIYSVVDLEKFKKFVESNGEILNPNELTLTYSILDSAGVKIDIYNLSIVDISFVF
ncbi:MAG: hypothetical protein CL623_06080 [Arcobacter sp.]|nr:hypothetical protein [Arcobacter sp.]